MSASPRRRLLLPEMEGGAARRYARQRGTEGQLAECRREAARLTAGLAEGARVLEVAPGPGYLSLEMARSGRLHVTGLDISRTMVEIATQKAREQGVAAEFRQGDVSEMPFAGQSFDLVVTQAAFKNFRRPLAALQEMHRVLREGGTAVVQDMSHEATRADIAREVRGMEQRGVSALITRWIFDGAAPPRLLAHRVPGAGRAEPLRELRHPDLRDRPGGPAQQAGWRRTGRPTRDTATA